MSKFDESEMKELGDEVFEMKKIRKVSKRSIIEEEDPIKPRVEEIF